MLNAIDLSAIDLNLLVLFDAVYTTRHVGRAASKLRVSPSAVSHGLGRLRALFDDPLFLRTPKGVLPNQRAQQLALPIAETLNRVRSVLSSVAPFDPQTSARSFTLGTADATAALLLPPLLSRLRHEAPRVDLRCRHLLPMGGGLSELETGDVDMLVLSLDDVPARFATKVVFEEEFLISGRSRHPFFRAPTLRSYCAREHALVSIQGEPRGHIDEVLAARGLSRRVALTVPNFMLLLAALAESDLLGAIPTSLAHAEAARFGLKSVRAPMPLRSWQVRAIVSQAALMDAGIAWLWSLVERAASDATAGLSGAEPGRSRRVRSRTGGR